MPLLSSLRNCPWGGILLQAPSQESGTSSLRNKTGELWVTWQICLKAIIHLIFKSTSPCDPPEVQAFPKVTELECLVKTGLICWLMGMISVTGFSKWVWLFFLMLCLSKAARVDPHRSSICRAYYKSMYSSTPTSIRPHGAGTLRLESSSLPVILMHVAFWDLN